MKGKRGIRAFLAAILACTLPGTQVSGGVRAEGTDAVPQVAHVSNDFYNGFSSAPSVITGENITAETRVFTMSVDKAVTDDVVGLYKASLELPKPAFSPDKCIEIPVLSNDGTCITAMLNGDFLFLANGGAVSRPYALGRLKVFWKDVDTVAPGGVVKVFGESYTTAPMALLRQGETYVDLTGQIFKDGASARNTDRYLLPIQIPADTAAGDWELLVNNGNTNYCWQSAGTLRVESAADKAASAVSVRDKGAKGDGHANDTKAFLNAIAAASKKGGDVLVPPGTYLVDQTLELPENVRLTGAGAGNTIIRGVGYDPATINNISWFSSDAYKMQVPFSVVLLNSHTAMTDVTVTGAVNRGKGGYGIVELPFRELNISTGGTCEDVLISGCVINGADQDNRTGVRWYRCAVYSPGSVERVRLYDNDLTGSLHLGGYNGVATRCDIVDNVIRGGLVDDVQAVSMFAIDTLFDSNTITDSPGRIVFTPIRHCYIRSNTFEGFAKQSYNNATEGILAHGENSHANRSAGYVDAADANTMTDKDGQFVPGVYKQAVVVIAYGKGMGQYRFVKSNTADTLELETPFNVPPDETSEYVVGHLVTENVYFDNVDDGVGHFNLSNDAIANVVENLRDNRAGVAFDSSDSSQVDAQGQMAGNVLDLSWYNVLNNSWSDGAAVQLLSKTGTKSAFNAAPAFANLISGCTINLAGADRNGFAKQGPIEALILAGGDKTKVSDRYDQSHTVIYNNELSNAPYGVKISKYSYKTVILSNHFSGVDTPMDNAGAKTIFKSNTKSIMKDGSLAKENLADVDDKDGAETVEVKVKPHYPTPESDRVLAWRNANLQTFVSSVSHRDVDDGAATAACARNLEALWKRLVKFEGAYGSLPVGEYYPEQPYESKKNIIRLLGRDAFDYGVCPTFSETLAGRTNMTYLWNERLNGQPLDNLADKENTWVLMDMSATHSWMVSSRFAGHEGGYHVLFADGTVKCLKPSDTAFTALLTDPKLADAGITPKTPPVPVYSQRDALIRPWVAVPAAVAAAAAAVGVPLLLRRRKKKKN